jgi:hypothetical protein
VHGLGDDWWQQLVTRQAVCKACRDAVESMLMHMLAAYW